MTPDLFKEQPRDLPLGDGAVLLGGFALSVEATLLQALTAVVDEAPFRHMFTPGGHRMSVAMTNCGAVGWVTDRTGYRYDPADPESGLPWPGMPDTFADLARRAAARAGFPGFATDACLVNRYEPGARLSLHPRQERAGVRRADRFRLARLARDFLIRRRETLRPNAPNGATPR